MRQLSSRGFASVSVHRTGRTAHRLSRGAPGILSKHCESDRFSVDLGEEIIATEPISALWHCYDPRKPWYFITQRPLLGWGLPTSSRTPAAILKNATFGGRVASRIAPITSSVEPPSPHPRRMRRSSLITSSTSSVTPRRITQHAPIVAPQPQENKSPDGHLIPHVPFARRTCRSSFHTTPAMNSSA